jgi:hypothetical protein
LLAEIEVQQLALLARLNLTEIKVHQRWALRQHSSYKSHCGCGPLITQLRSWSVVMRHRCHRGELPQNKVARFFFRGIGGVVPEAPAPRQADKGWQAHLVH